MHIKKKSKNNSFDDSLIRLSKHIQPKQPASNTKLQDSTQADKLSTLPLVPIGTCGFFK